MTEYSYQSQLAQSRRKPNTTPDTPTARPGERYAVEGYMPPEGVVGTEAVKEMQRWLGGLTVDGILGSKASAASGG